LAIKLVVGSARQLPLAVILDDFRQKRLEQVDEMYRHIYRQTWQTLSTEARILFQAMSLIAESGALPDHMQRVSGLTDGALFWKAISELISCSLLEVSGTSKERRYGIHALSRAFLNTDLSGWSPDES
jgi:hypothetical protein